MSNVSDGAMQRKFPKPYRRGQIWKFVAPPTRESSRNEHIGCNSGTFFCGDDPRKFPNSIRRLHIGKFFAGTARESSRNQAVGGNSGTFSRRRPVHVPDINSSEQIGNLLEARTRESSRNKFVGGLRRRLATVPDINSSGANRKLCFAAATRGGSRNQFVGANSGIVASTLDLVHHYRWRGSLLKLFEAI